MSGVVVGAPSPCTICPAVGTFPPSWDSPRGGEDLRQDQGTILLASGRILPAGGAKTQFLQSLNSPTHYFCPFQQDLNGPGGTSTQKQPRAPIHSTNSGLCHLVPGNHSPAHHGQGIARELVMLFSCVGIPNKILIDEGIPFMS